MPYVFRTLTWSNGEVPVVRNGVPQPKASADWPAIVAVAPPASVRSSVNKLPPIVNAGNPKLEPAS